ncbi:VOC family protein [Caulobacter sp. 17J80-11]|uniref:VOC family protein n=1 Tax=Caulobacter sp. 17J80-11 TaxID=2763502 RepID=UPI001653C2F9|nr:VOC family protein [Caulobacter sp. 17J80-11]MBC6981661.1 VOC family protein [Caulobacter sp. 17J80-11]
MQITAYDHVGLRVVDRARSLVFYESLGFVLDAPHSNERALELVATGGVRINLILNGETPPDGRNVLMDVDARWPGYTHAAFVVDRLDALLAWAAARGVPITEGPVDWGRRRTCFLRDPDGNVLEFNELTPAATAHTLVTGNKNYSSWSMRAWMLMKFAGVPFEEAGVLLYRPGSREAVKRLGGETGLAPVLLAGDHAIWDTLAIFEYVAELNPAVWPRDQLARARARSWCGEVHAGFNHLRAAMPANVRGRNRKAEITPEVEADIARAAHIWSQAGGEDGPWLFGAFSGADVMFAPVAARFVTYGVQLDGRAREYHQALLAHPLSREWAALGQTEADVIPDAELPEA